MKRWHWDTRGGPLVQVDVGAYYLVTDVWKLLNDMKLTEDQKKILAEHARRG